MDGDPGPARLPNLADDERRLAEVAAELLDTLLAAIPGWVDRTVTERARSAGIDLGRGDLDRVAATGHRLAERLRDPLTRVLTADVDTAVGTPLALLRAGVGGINDLLDDMGVPRPARGRFEADRFPDDRHLVGPASFADVDDAVHGPGLLWGAARARVHLRRRQEGA